MENNLIYDASPKYLKSDEGQDRLNRLIGWRRQARLAQSENRAEMAIDEDFYDSIQLEAQDLQILESRKQPPLMFNMVKNTVNWILGTEKRARIDYRVLPRTKDDGKAAKTKTKVFKYIEDCSDGIYHQSSAFENCVKVGLGWLEAGVRQTGDEPIFERSVPWRNMWFDHLGTSLDGSDWRYEIREKWIDLDYAQYLWPKRKEELEILANNINSIHPYITEDFSIADPATEFDYESDMDSIWGDIKDVRQRVKIVEMWYRIPARIKVLQRADDGENPYGVLDGAIYRPEQEDHKYLVKDGYFTVQEVNRMIIRQALWSGRLYLEDNLSPYNHWRLPIIPMFCYRRKRDNMPYGVIRDIRDAQRDLNMRKIRSLFLLSAHQVAYEKGTVDDPVKLADELNRPDGQIELNEGTLSGKKIHFMDHAKEVQANVEMARDDERFIESISGVTPENKGTTARDLSGKAIDKLQNQGFTTSGVFFDNYYYAFKLKGEILNALIEQFMDTEKEILVSGDQVKDDFVTINHTQEDGSIDNCITRSKARFTVGRQDYRESIRMAMYQTLSEMVMAISKTMPEVALNLFDLVVDFMDDLPQKDEMVARIRKLNGQRDPTEDMTPEERAEAERVDQEQAAKAKAMEDIQMAIAEAKAAGEAAKANSESAKAMKTQVEAQMVKLEAFLKALEAAGVLQMNPDIARAADTLIDESQKAIPGNGGGMSQ